MSLVEFGKRAVALLICITMISPTLAFASTPCEPSPTQPLPDDPACAPVYSDPTHERQISPVQGTISYVRPSTPTTSNPERFYVGYTDLRTNKVYDVHIDLTAKRAVVIDTRGIIVGSRMLFDNEVATVRESGVAYGRVKAYNAVFWGVIGTIAAGLILLAATDALDELKERRECARAMTVNANQLANDAAQCAANGGHFEITSKPSMDACGGGFGFCMK